MTEPVYTIATVFTWATPWQETFLAFEDYFNVLKDNHSDLLARSEIYTENDNTTSRRWTNVEDAQAWLDIFSAFITENNLDATGKLVEIANS